MVPTVRVREFRTPDDVEAVSSLDTSVEVRETCTVQRAGNSTCLVRVDGPARRKTFPIDLSVDPWERGFVAVADDVVIGFVATGLSRWNRRLVIWHFYVAPEWRKRGVGRQLLEHALEVGRQDGAYMAWAETSNLNVPGIDAYERLGFSVCGFDATLYAGTANSEEFAVFLGRRLSAGDGQ